MPWNPVIRLRRPAMAADAVAASVHIDAPPERVYEYFTRPEAIVSWMGEYALLEAEPGGRFVLDIKGAPVRGRFLELDPAAPAGHQLGLRGLRPPATRGQHRRSTAHCRPRRHPRRTPAPRPATRRAARACQRLDPLPRPTRACRLRPTPRPRSRHATGLAGARLTVTPGQALSRGNTPASTPGADDNSARTRQGGHWRLVLRSRRVITCRRRAGLTLAASVARAG
jgi:hypothetical protein